MSTPDAPDETGAQVESPVNSDPPAEPGPQEQEQQKANEVAVEITEIKASGLPAKVGLFGGVFYVSVKGGKVPQKTKTAKYTKGDEYVASWGDTVKLSGLESAKVEVEVYAKRFFFSYKVIKKTESKETLADLLEHTETPIELELLEEGQAAGKLVFKISRSASGKANDPVPPATAEDSDVAPPLASELTAAAPVAPASPQDTS